MSELTLLTTTGERPEAWRICELLMNKQTYSGNVRWVIVDDGSIQQPVTFQRINWKLEIVRPVPFWRVGVNTQSRNLLSGLEKIGKNERVVIIEDDDYYDSRYLSFISECLNKYDMVGEAPSRYFNVSTGRGRLLPNNKHSGLCSTAVKGMALEELRTSSRRNFKFIDINLWKKFNGSKLLYDSRMVVGIKGLPGRKGIGAGHRDTFGEPMDLRQWIGDDVDIYKKLITSGVSNAY